MRDIEADRAALEAANKELQFHLWKETARAERLATTDKERRQLLISSSFSNSLWTAIYHVQAARFAEPGPISSIDLLNDAGRHLVSLTHLEGFSKSDFGFKLRVQSAEEPAAFAGRSGLCWSELLQLWAFAHSKIFLLRIPSWITAGTAIANAGRDLEEALRFGLPFDVMRRHHFACEEWVNELRELQDKNHEYDGDNTTRYFLTDAEISEVNAELIDLAGFYDSPEEPEAEPVEAGAEPVESKKPKRAAKHKNINARMIETIQKNHEAAGSTSPRWAAFLKCSSSSVTNAATWQNLQDSRDLAKSERRENQHSQ